jgi:hypothetical protein
MDASAKRPSAPVSDYVLRHGGNELPLRPGTTLLIGRAPDCHLVLSDPMVSRHHARVAVGASIVLEDLGSVNGLFVDGRRVDRVVVLRPGQCIRIGAQKIQLNLTERSLRQRSPTRPATRSRLETLPETLSPDSRERTIGEAAADKSFASVALELSGRLLGQDRGEEAERLIEDVLTDVLEAARADSGVEAEIVQLCAERALDLAEATGSARWLAYVFDLHAALGRLMPEALVNQSYRVIRCVRRPPLGAIQSYLHKFQGPELELGPSERFRLKRLSGLARMAASR